MDRSGAQARLEQIYLIFSKIYSSALYHDKDKCLTLETGMIQDCYKLEHHTALNIVDVRSIAMPQRITIGQFCSGTAPLFLLKQ